MSKPSCTMLEDVGEPSITPKKLTEIAKKQALRRAAIELFESQKVLDKLKRRYKQIKFTEEVEPQKSDSWSEMFRCVFEFNFESIDSPIREQLEAKLAKQTGRRTIGFREFVGYGPSKRMSRMASRKAAILAFDRAQLLHVEKYNNFAHYIDYKVSQIEKGCEYSGYGSISLNVDATCERSTHL